MTRERRQFVHDSGPRCESDLDIVERTRVCIPIELLQVLS